MTNHSFILEKLLYSKAEREEQLGIEGVIWGASEVPWWKGNQLYCETDLLFFTGSTYQLPYFVIEYKRTNNERQHGLVQLERSSEYIKEFHDSDCYKLFVTGKYKQLEYEIIGKHPRKK